MSANSLQYFFSYLSALAAPVIIVPPINTNVLQHNDTTLNCTATSEPFSTFTWFHNVNPLNNLMTKYTVAFHNHSDLREYSSTLTVHNATIDDIGTYTCVVTNIHGTQNASVNVEVQGKLWIELIIMFIAMIITI